MNQTFHLQEFFFRIKVFAIKIIALLFKRVENSKLPKGLTTEESNKHRIEITVTTIYRGLTMCLALSYLIPQQFIK